MTDNQEKPKQVFIIATRHSKEPVRDFQQILSDLNNNWGLNVIQQGTGSAQISNNMGYAANLELIQHEEFAKQGFRLSMQLNVYEEDESTFSIVRSTLSESRFSYHIFSEKLDAFIPLNNNISICGLGSYNIESYRIMNNFNLTPVYFYQLTNVYYAKTDDGKMVIVNSALLDFMYQKEIPETELPELSYEVAPSVQKFGYMFDCGLIPRNFYEYYKKDQKIINKSYFDINNPGRKVFIKPYIFELLDDRNEFYTQAGDGSSLLAMDKIRQGETLDMAIKRVISKELQIADDYIGAVVTENAEFDRDKEGIITPRLIVFIYVDKIKNRDWALKMSQTSWRSLDGSLATKPPRED